MSITMTPCASCASRCCRELAVTVSIPDVARLVRALHVPVHDLLARYVDEDPNEEPYAFVIRRQPIALALNPPGTDVRGCPFVAQIGTQWRCGIYDLRPGTCRVYPFSRQRGRVYHKRSAICHRRFQIADADRPEISAAIDAYQRDWDRHAVFAREWNANPPRNPSFEKLLDFVEEIIETGRV